MYLKSCGYCQALTKRLDFEWRQVNRPKMGVYPLILQGEKKEQKN